MMTASLFGYAAMIALGLVLGLIGAGGSILVVPILVYLFGIPATEATGYSLLIVGTSALFGALARPASGPGRRSLADLQPEPYPDRNERLSDDID